MSTHHTVKRVSDFWLIKSKLHPDAKFIAFKAERIQSDILSDTVLIYMPFEGRDQYTWYHSKYNRDKIRDEYEYVYDKPFFLTNHSILALQQGIKMHLNYSIILQVL